MLVEANEKCTMSGTADGCSVFEASRDEKKRDGCVSEGTVVDEVGPVYHYQTHIVP